jgi:hypothetical protein
MSRRFFPRRGRLFSYRAVDFRRFFGAGHLPVPRIIIRGIL